MALITLPNNKKISHKRKSLRRALWTISSEAFDLPFSFTCLPDGKEEERQELRKVFRFFFDGLPLPTTNFFNWFVSHLPMMAWQADSLPGSLSIFFLTKSLFKQTEIALFDGIKQFLLGSRDIKMLKFSHQDFIVGSFSTARFVAGEIKFLVETPEGARFAEKSLPFFKESCLKCFRSYQSVLTYESRKFYHKIDQIKTDLTRFCFRFPHLFEEDIFDFFSGFSALTTKKFREKRSSALLRRIFLSLYFVKRQLMETLKGAHHKNMVKLRIFPTGREDRAIGVVVAVYLTSKYEYFGEDGLLVATQKGLPNICPVYQSFSPFSKQGDAIQTFYLELKKEDSQSFLKKEISFLRRTFPMEIAKRIERLSPRAFGTCFEEEIMKNTTVLMREVESCPSCPNMMIFFERVEAQKLFFTLLLVRQKKKKEKPLEALLKKTDPVFLCILDRLTIIGEMEVNIFHIQLTKTPNLMRSDGAVHFALARKKIVKMLEKELGEIRDYNGGLFEKKDESLTALKKAFPQVDPERLETFFYSIRPVTSQVTLDIKLLCRFFELFLKYCEKPSCQLYFFDDKEVLFAHISADFVSRFSAPFPDVILAHVNNQMSFFLIRPEAKTKQLFKASLREIFLKSKKEKPHLRISLEEKPSLDPRRGGDRNTTMILRALFEGLTRFDKKGKVVLAVAKNCAVSSDQKKYTLTLRKSYWSNATPVTADDFEYAWKTALEPCFYAYFPELFYCIKNAEKAKHGRVPLDEVGCTAKDCHTLIIDLEHPTPDFLERLAHTLFLPVPRAIAQKDPCWMEREGEAFVSNGPFCLAQSSAGHLLNFKKNEHYHSKKRVKIDCVSVVKASAQEGIRLFRENKLDFFEVPSRTEADLALKARDLPSVSLPAPHITWLAVNTTSFPLKNVHFRMALAASLDRDKLKAMFPCCKESALTLLPPHLTSHADASFLPDFNPERARIYLNSALLALGLSQDNVPPISLMVPGNRLRSSLAKAIKTMWETALGISCTVESYPWPIFYQRRLEKKFQLAIVEWGIPTSDPLSTLSAFNKREDKLNLSAWEDISYQKLLKAAQRETDPGKRKTLSAQLEEILIRQLPALPLFYGRYWFFKRSNLHISLLAPTFNGMPDFSHFSFKPQKGSL